MSAAHYLAFDLGASSGRAVLGSFDGSRLALKELHRFTNGPVTLPDGLHWDTPKIFEEIKKGLVACRTAGVTPDALGIDTWGVDYGLLDAKGDLLTLPHHYRDPRTHGMMEEAFTRVPRAEIYTRTGIQFMALNTVYQLLADLKAADAPLTSAASMLLTPNLLNYWLTGVRGAEESIASTTQLYDPKRRAWDFELIERLGLPRRIFPEIVAPGTTVGPLRKELADELGMSRIPVIAPGCHDTASAVAAVPASGDDWAYISSGTWSLVGIELPAPVCTPEALAANFTNEAGVSGTTRFHKNVAGLWLVQECQRVWATQGKNYGHEQLISMASQARPPLAALIDPDDDRFSEFGDMPARIRQYCSEHGQPVPESDGALVRCVLESLALKYRVVIDSAERITGKRVKTVHLVGGGVNNALLCQFTADATGRPVIAGPVEATAAGNVLVQALGQGRVSSLREIRRVVAGSSELKRYEPKWAEGWEQALVRFQALGADSSGDA